MSMRDNCLKQGSADHGPLAILLPPLFGNKVLLAESHIHLFMCCLRLFLIPK